jgi:uncharacterized protein (DUF433 family)
MKMITQIEAHRFTPAEAAALAELPEKQVRKELEYRVIESDIAPHVSFAALAYLSLVRRSELSLPVSVRADLYRRIVKLLLDDTIPQELEVLPPFYLRIDDKIEILAQKVSRFLAWKGRLISDPTIMGGSVVFPRSRLTVRHVGGMLERGVDMHEIMEDYPELSPEDLAFSKIFVRAYPLVGRPGRDS